MGCGIAGFVGLSDRHLLQKMLEVQRHRGPDSMGLYIGNGVALGCDRLSIIDLVKGDQPIRNEDESVWVVFNGEIYNYLELRGELEARGHRFYTDGDTEVLVHGYEEWGEACLERLRGMFAFAIWDDVRRRLFAARDRFGKKPFYYTLVDGAFLFSSELKGLLQHEGVERRLEPKAMDFFFTYTYIPSPYTIFRGIYKLPPGHQLVLDGAGLRVKEYWDLSFNPCVSDEGEAVERLYSLISEAVKVRLRSDVPLGSFLSGGIDSSTVTAVMAKVSREPVRTVTVGFEEGDDHLRYGRMVAEHLSTDHREYLVTPSSLKLLPRLIWHFDEPFADPSLIPTYHVSEAARREVKVALTGDGGDEMFMGYPFLKDQPIYHIYRVIPHGLRRIGLQLIQRTPWLGEWRKMAAHALEKNYGPQDFKGRFVLRMVVFTPETLSKLYSPARMAEAPPTNTLTYLHTLMAKQACQDQLSLVNYATFKSYLSEMILTKVDRMSMAVSLEARSPLLDHLLAEYVALLPSHMKYRGRTTKYIFKKMALEKRLLPKQVIYREKAGFGPPVDRWLGREWRDISSQILDRAGRTGLFNREYLSKLLKDQYVNSSKIFCISIFTLWYNHYVEMGDVRHPLNLDALI